MEILGHHRTEKHLRRDHRWRYEHLKSTGPISGKVQHRVKGRDGKILSKINPARDRLTQVHPDEVGGYREKISYLREFRPKACFSNRQPGVKSEFS